MKDKTLYWILGIIAAYFVIRFVMNQIAGKNQENNQTAKNGIFISGYGLKQYPEKGYEIGDDGPLCEFCGSTTHYKNGGSLDNPVPFRVCDNPRCRSNMFY